MAVTLGGNVMDAPFASRGRSGVVQVKKSAVSHI
jgi:hypothetical protein